MVNHKTNKIIVCFNKNNVWYYHKYLYGNFYRPEMKNRHFLNHLYRSKILAITIFIHKYDYKSHNKIEVFHFATVKIYIVQRM